MQFAFGQPTAKIVFAEFGGQMNVCEDGQPPLRTCADRPSALLPPAALCANGKPPVDTEEVAAAIRAAGGQTQEEMLRSWAAQVDAGAHAATKAREAATPMASKPPHGSSLGGK